MKESRSLAGPAQKAPIISITTRPVETPLAAALAVVRRIHCAP
jgi:hypothetical protein